MISTTEQRIAAWATVVGVFFTAVILIFTFVEIKSSIGDVCEIDKNCQKGYCVHQNANVNNPKVCTAGRTGIDVCLGDDQCKSGYCNRAAKGVNGICSTGKKGEGCENGSNCRSGMCNQSIEICK